MLTVENKSESFFVMLFEYAKRLHIILANFFLENMYVVISLSRPDSGPFFSPQRWLEFLQALSQLGENISSVATHIQEPKLSIQYLFYVFLLFSSPDRASLFCCNWSKSSRLSCKSLRLLNLWHSEDEVVACDDVLSLDNCSSTLVLNGWGV